MNDISLDQIISRYDSPTGKVLGILRDIQHLEGYLPKDSLIMLSDKLNVHLSELYSLATFYSFFSLKPVGEHLITVCMGTPCHVKGAEKNLAVLEELLGLKQEVTTDGKYSRTTKDDLFTIEIARCYGACSMAPVVQIDGELHGYVTPERLPGILARYGWKRDQVRTQ